MTAHGNIPAMTTHRSLLFLISALLVLAASACSTPAAATPEPTAEPTEAAATAPATDPWSLNAAQHRSQVGEEFTYDCPPADESRLDTIWGTDIYTDDSSVCTAAVHAGVITVEDGGEVTIEIAPGEESYEGTEQNGIESSPYGPWGGSFVVVTD
jgi:LCCL domain